MKVGIVVPFSWSFWGAVNELAKIRRALDRERVDVLHVHEPMTPAVSVAAMTAARCPVVATWHAAGPLRWNRGAVHFWGFLMNRVDYRIAVSEQARRSVERMLPGAYEVIPNGVLMPPCADPGGREHRIVFAGRHDPRKGLSLVLRGWPEIRRRTGARLRIAGADPLAVRLLLTRYRVSDDGIDVLGLLSQEQLTEELLAAKALVAPSVGMESFGMVLARAFGCALPVVASDIPGYRDVMTAETGVLVAPGDIRALTDAVVALLADERRRCAMGSAARSVAEERYSWDRIAARLLDVYDLVAGTPRPAPLSAPLEAVPA